ncbi:MAG: YraN family protein [Candidatus Terrybacteria bacterium]|nr:YraN family protein [Candidatus Terrybacteria bacterium]
MQTDKQKIGEIGENTACKFLMKQGFIIKDRNYRKKWGEIDIIAQDETEWQVDIMAVFLDFNAKKAKIRTTENVIL